MYIGERQALIVQEFQSLSELVKMAFGSDPKKKRQAELANVPVPKSANEAKAHFARVFG